MSAGSILPIVLSLSNSRFSSWRIDSPFSSRNDSVPPSAAFSSSFFTEAAKDSAAAFDTRLDALEVLGALSFLSEAFPDLLGEDFRDVALRRSARCCVYQYRPIDVAKRSISPSSPAGP